MLEAQLAGKRADCAGRIYRHHAARRSFRARMNALHQIDVTAVESGLCGDRKKAQHARIDRLVDWMANAGNDALFGTIAVDDLRGELDEVRAGVISAIGKCLLEHDRRMFHATDEHAAQAAQAAATAACSASGAPAMVMRAAIELGVMPCSTRLR